MFIIRFKIYNNLFNCFCYNIMARIRLLFLSAFLLAGLSSCKNASEEDNVIMQPSYSGGTLQSSTTVLSNIKISDSELKAIGYRIYLNECSGKTENLTYWNSKEPFPSMGMGHFIWYATNYDSPLGDSFSKMLFFYEQNGIKLPSWIKKTNYKVSLDY